MFTAVSTNTIRTLPEKTVLTFKSSSPLKNTRLKRAPNIGVSFKSSSYQNFHTPDTPSDNLIDHDVFTTKHANSLIDIKKSYYDMIDKETQKEIFISYETNANIQERRFIVDLARQLKENYLSDDIWFDKDELLIGKPIWTVSRLEAAERSSAAVLIVTPSYFENPLNIYESKTLLDHKLNDDDFYLAVIVLYIKGYPRLNNATSTLFNDSERIRGRKILQNFSLLQPIIDKSNLFINLSDPKLMPISIAEKVSHCVGVLTTSLERYAKFKRPAPPLTPFDESDNIIDNEQDRGNNNDTPFNLSISGTSLSIYSLHNNNYIKTYAYQDLHNKKNAYSFKSLITFKPNDVQQFLEDIGVDEYYRQNIADYRVDGFLLSSITDEDLTYIFDIDNKMTRKKIRTAISDVMQNELQSSENWHLQLKYIKPHKMNTIYVIFDPQDQALITPFLNELKHNNLDISYHHGFGSSKEEFMKINSTSMAKSRFILVYLTEASANSKFVIHECIFSQLVINKPKIITIMAKNVWKMMRHTLKSILGDQLALDFTSNNLKTNIKPLLQFFKPKFSTYEPLVKLEKTSGDENALKSLDLLANTSSNQLPFLDKVKVFISQVTDHWETQKRLEQLLSGLETFNIKCWFDLFSVESQRAKNPFTKHFDEGANNSLQPLNLSSSNNNNNNNSNNNINNNSLKTAQVLICCISPKYLNSDICVKDVNLAEALHIPIIPILLKPCSWPPENIQFQVRRVLAPLKCIDISNDALLKRNLPQIISSIHQAVSKLSRQFNKIGTSFNDQFTASEQVLLSHRSFSIKSKK